jgi:hypothetical protein
VLQTAADRFPRHGASQVVVGPALPGFKIHFDLATNQLTSDEWQQALDQSLQPLLESL